MCKSKLNYTVIDSLTLSADNTFGENVKEMAVHYHNSIKPGHGLFFDFKATPQYKKPFLDYLVQHFGWTLEKTFFIRKPDQPG